MVRSFLFFMIPPPFTSFRGGGLLFGLENSRVSKLEESCVCTWSFRIRGVQQLSGNEELRAGRWK